MAKQILGRVSVVFKGEFDLNTQYTKLDIVNYEGSSYSCIEDTKGILPTNVAYWTLVASKGENGEKGEQGERGEKGDTPVKGVDYFTEEDIANLNIPKNTSDLINDSDFTNKEYVDEAIENSLSQITSFKYEVVENLPIQDISTSTIYLKLSEKSENENVYDEFIYVNNSWELIGTTKIDLSNYYTKEESDNILDDTLGDIDMILDEIINGSLEVDNKEY